MAVDILDHLLALHITAANEQERAEVEALAAAVQETTSDSVELAYVDQSTAKPLKRRRSGTGSLEVVSHLEA